jgi:uncharacterized damage-inducible protein DinB
MSITQVITEYAAYDRWANARFVERLSREPDDVLDRPAASSFPTLRATLLHIRDAEHTWWGRLTGAPTRWPAEEDRGIATLLRHCEVLFAAVQELSEADLLSERVYTDLRGNTHRQAAWRMLMHCFNHSTQHRGQLITQMRALGLGEIPANDLVVFQRLAATSP